MRECDINELHQYILDMLKYVDEICKANHITYFLSGGSAIGALRHHGFIPWDDDADIMMPRDDYMRFLEVTRDASDRYKTGSLYGDNDWTFPFARIWDTTTNIVYENLNEAQTGIFIDIYPMDGLPDSMLKTKIHYYGNKVCYVFLNAAIRKRFKDDEKHIFLKRCLGVIAKKVGAKNICKHLDKKAAKRKFNDANYVGCTLLAHYMCKERFPREDFLDMNYVDFEDTKLPVPNGCDDYLRHLYGDYMCVPKETERESEHHMHIYIQ